MERLSKYNYFDDDFDDYEERPSKFHFHKIEAADVQEKLTNFFYGARERALERLTSTASPESRRARISFSAGIAVLIAASIIITCVVFSAELKKANTVSARYYSAAGEVCTQLLSEHGVCKAELSEDGESYYLSGLVYARQMDFDGDGKPELLASYYSASVYYVEVWGYDGADFVKKYSGKANSLADNASAGSWISIYHHSGKYYIGELADETKMNLLSLGSKEFKPSKDCEYDAVNDIYVVNGKINSVDFETIKLSCLTDKRAERMTEAVTSALASFNTQTIQQIQASKSAEQLRKEAYYEIIQKYNDKYGKAYYDSSSTVCFAGGLAVVDLIDFNADGTDELLVVYRYDKKIAGEDKKGNYEMTTEPEYRLEIYYWNGSSAVKALENDGVSTLQNEQSEQRFYILQRDGSKTNLCRNTYVYNKDTSKKWKATSRISEMDELGEFSSPFVAVVNSSYGYLTYELNGEKVYRKEFNEKGYKVPTFCNNDDYDENEFEIIYLQGKAQEGSQIKSVVSETQKTIKEINKNYAP